MPKNITHEELLEHLREQIIFLQSSAKAYDCGAEIEAKRMAVTLRVLLHDAGNSSSLLGQLHLKKEMEFISTAQKYDITNFLSQQCLLSLQIGAGSARYIPLFENDNRYRLLSCKDWMEEIVLSDAKKQTFRRKNILRLLANKDGGAHVDPSLDDTCAAMKTPAIGGWLIQKADGTSSPFDNDPVYATMRQMTFEVLHSIFRGKPELFSEAYF